MRGVFRKTERAISLESEMLEGNRSDETQIADEFPLVSSDNPVSASASASAEPATYSESLKKPLPALPKIERRR